MERGATAPLGGNRKQSTIGGQVQTLSIDPAGNRSTDGQTNYTYDAVGRLVQATSAIGTTRYQINALNQRTRKTGPLGETTYLHDRQGHLLAEADSQGRIQREYVWLGDHLLAILDGDPSATQVYAVHPDPLGTPRAVTDPSGKTIWRAAPASEPFGLSVEQDPDGDGTPFVLNLRFPGQYYDQETNLAYNWHRYYDERVGSYTTSDPIGLAAGQWSTYAYAGGAPTMRGDPLGLAPKAASGTQQFPPKQCNANEMRECKAQCGNRGVDACYVRRSLQIVGVTGEGKKRYGVKEDVICSCNDEESNCPDEKSLFQKFLQGLTGSGSRSSGDTGIHEIDGDRGSSSRSGMPPVGPPPAWRYLLP